jgi:sigma-B regulation protein RsbU (phosphoserine phosphatase)
MNPPDPTLALVRDHIGEILLGTVFLFIGVIACLAAALRRRREFHLLVWFGLFIGIYGARILAHVAGVLNLFPQSSWPKRFEIAGNYLLVVPSFLFWAERTKSHLRRAFQILAAIGSGIAAVGLTWYAISGQPYTFIRWTLMLAMGTTLVFGTLAAFPSLYKKYFNVQSLVLRVVMPALAVLVLVVDVMLYLGHPPPYSLEPIAFAIWVFAIGYEAAKHTFDNERRLLSIESELETARHIQSSLLPDRIPTVSGLRIAASYSPMSAVAGDYYQFVQSDDNRIGILVADVTGHGVPAALIASMIKVAMQSAAAVAHEPGQVMRQLNQILTPELNGRLTSAAYLWIDMERHCARYSAAGHPDLLHWRACQEELLRIESNGLLFGVKTDVEYPVHQLTFCCNDRFLLYTDGLVEPENVRGESFGDRKLEETLRRARLLQAPELSRELLSALRKWQPTAAEQQDDITLIAVDIL